MKFCKKLVAIVLAAAMFAVCIPAIGAEEPGYPEVPEGYDGYVTFAVSTIIMGWDYLVDPILVPVNEGDTLAVVTERALDSLCVGYSYYGTVEEGFYLDGIECYDTEPNIPDYLMEQILAYPEWADAQFGYNFGGWNGYYEDDDMLSSYEYCDQSGWMFTEDNIPLMDGADVVQVKPGSVYTWFFSVYGWGMDYGVSDGWGSFPLFDNPMEGVDRTEVSRVLSLVTADEELCELAFEAAAEELMGLLELFYDPNSSQEQLDAALEAFLAALGMGGEYEQGDVNMNGSVDSADALLIMRYAMELVDLSEAAAALADYNGNGTVDFEDALLVLRSSL